MSSRVMSKSASDGIACGVAPTARILPAWSAVDKTLRDVQQRCDVADRRHRGNENF
jgi:hypothetical protein